MIHGISFARCDSKGLLDSLCTRILATHDGNITMSLDVVAATVNRDTLAKTIYSRLFDWYALVLNWSNETSGVCPHDAKLQSETLIHCLDSAHFRIILFLSLRLLIAQSPSDCFV
jgi:myosin heavy subunit